MGLRLLEHFCHLDTARSQIMSSGVLYLMLGLLRTNDHETLVAATSFLVAIIRADSMPDFKRIKLIPLLVNVIKEMDPELVNNVTLLVFEIM